MIDHINKVIGEFFYAIFASFILFAGIFIFVLLILLPFIVALFLAKNNPGIHPLIVFGSVFVTAFIEYFVLSLSEYFEKR